MTFSVKHYVGAKGTRLTAEVGGERSAPTVLLLHGGGQTHHSWGRAMHELVARGYHVINLDARGHGDSEWASDGDYSLKTLALDLERVIATLSTTPALVGASMGGAAAMTLIGSREEPVAAALVLVDIVPQMAPEGASRIRDFMTGHSRGFASLEEAGDAVSAYNHHRPRPRNLSGLMKNLRLRSDGRLYWHWDPRVVETPGETEPPMLVEQLSLAANRVRIPTLLVRGMRSDVVTDEGVADIKSRIPHIELCEVSGAGHMVAGDKNDGFNRGVIEFLGRYLPLTT
jgi:pimeloyl-ACP methyl ester carboxylesterase